MIDKISSMTEIQNKIFNSELIVDKFTYLITLKLCQDLDIFIEAVNKITKSKYAKTLLAKEIIALTTSRLIAINPPIFFAMLCQAIDQAKAKSIDDNTKKLRLHPPPSLNGDNIVISFVKTFEFGDGITEDRSFEIILEDQKIEPVVKMELMMEDFHKEKNNLWRDPDVNDKFDTIETRLSDLEINIVSNSQSIAGINHNINGIVGVRNENEKKMMLDLSEQQKSINDMKTKCVDTEKKVTLEISEQLEIITDMKVNHIDKNKNTIDFITNNLASITKLINIVTSGGNFTVQSNSTGQPLTFTTIQLKLI